MKLPLSAALAACLSLTAHAADRGPNPVQAASEAAALPKIVRANPDRSYPPSCLSYPVSTEVRGPSITKTVRLGDVFGNQSIAEDFIVTVYRVACSGGKSALMIKFDRLAANAGNPIAPDVPAPSVQRTQSQGGDLGLRINVEPNTLFNDVFAKQLFDDATLVIEQFQGFDFDLNQAFTLALDTQYGGQVRRETFVLPAYDAATHPDGARALEINGYTTGTYFDPQRSGEGLFWEVAERPDGTRFAFFSWFTYAPDGRPAWIIGNADVAVDARTLTVATFHFSGGGFAGDFTTVERRPWGNVTFSFPNCNTLTLQYASTHSDANVPAGSGTRTWTRLSSINGFVCE